MRQAFATDARREMEALFPSISSKRGRKGGQSERLRSDLMALLSRSFLGLALGQPLRRQTLAQHAQPQFLTLPRMLKPDRAFRHLVDLQVRHQLHQIQSSARFVGQRKCPPY